MRDNGAEQLAELDTAEAAELPGDDPNRATDDGGDLDHLSSADDAPEDFTESAAGSYHSVTDGEVD